jgi:hypothetical protein
MAKWTQGKVKAKYTIYRRNYFLDHQASTGEVRTPPTAKELRWVWLPEKSPDLAETVWDDDDNVFDIAINLSLLYWPDMLKVTLLHELTHMRLGPDIKCPSMVKGNRAQPAWTREMVRLANLGAPLL